MRDFKQRLIFKVLLNFVLFFIKLDPCLCFTIEYNTNYPFNDIVVVVEPRDNYQLCCATCLETSGCNAFIYGTGNRDCYAKTHFGGSESGPGAVGGSL